MRIGIDGRELLGNRTGVGRYLAELCSEWLHSPRASRHEFVVYTAAPGTEIGSLGRPFQGEVSERFQHRNVSGRSGPAWEQLDLPTAAARDELDVFFAPAYSAPLQLRTPVVVTMHDVSFMAHPEWFTWREGARRRWLAARTMARADAVITVSAFTRSEVQRFFEIPSHRIHVVRSGTRPRSSPSRSDGSDRLEPLVLYVGSIFNRRHLPTLVRAFAKVRGAVPSAKLTLVGDDRTYPREDLRSLFTATGTADAVSLRSYVSESELDDLYGRARVFAFLSEYEGFGLTPLEAMSAGVPAVVGDTPVARELYADAAVFVPIRDVRATAAALRSLLLDDTMWATHRDRASRLLPTFAWERAANETLDVLESAGRRPAS
jgi:glycosyltransferase involved in cell wall biosynthesis